MVLLEHSFKRCRSCLLRRMEMPETSDPIFCRMEITLSRAAADFTAFRGREKSPRCIGVKKDPHLRINGEQFLKIEKKSLLMRVRYFRSKKSESHQKGSNCRYSFSSMDVPSFGGFKSRHNPEFHIRQFHDSNTDFI